MGNTRAPKGAKKKKGVTVHLDEEMYQHLRFLAENENRSVSNMVSMLLKDAMNKKENLDDSDKKKSAG